MTDCFCEQNFGWGCKHAPLTNFDWKSWTVKKKNRGNWNKGYRQALYLSFLNFNRYFVRGEDGNGILEKFRRYRVLTVQWDDGFDFDQNSLWTINVVPAEILSGLASDFAKKSGDPPPRDPPDNFRGDNIAGSHGILMTRFGSSSPEISTTMRAEFCSHSSKIWKSSAYATDYYKVSIKRPVLLNLVWIFPKSLY